MNWLVYKYGADIKPFTDRIPLQGYPTAGLINIKTGEIYSEDLDEDCKVEKLQEYLDKC